jgi:hypothetical protein
MDRVLRAILRTELPFFIRKVFATISPGETYLHNWHVDAITHQLMRVHSGRLAARPRSDTPCGTDANASATHRGVCSFGVCPRAGAC